MNEIQIFNYNSNEVRTIQKGGEPWFVLKDVCQILGLGTPAKVAERLDPDEKGMNQIHTPGGAQPMTTINESGLYNVILRSDKPEAKPFRKWVTSEVLPTIRKHGMYATPDTVEKMLADPDTTIKLLETIKQERAARLALESKVAEDKPKVLFANAVATSHTSILIGDLAKLIKQNGVNIGQNRLFDWMRNNGWLIKGGASKNMPTQKAMELGLFEVKETTNVNPDGSVRINRTTKVTGKGQQYFVNAFLK